MQGGDSVGIFGQWGDKVEERLVVNKLVLNDIRPGVEADELGTDEQDIRQTVVDDRRGMIVIS